MSRNVVASATRSKKGSTPTPSIPGKTRKSSPFSLLVEKVRKKRSPRVSPSSGDGIETGRQKISAGSFMRKMASEGAEDVEDMETEMSPERKFAAAIMPRIIFGGGST